MRYATAYVPELQDFAILWQNIDAYHAAETPETQGEALKHIREISDDYKMTPQTLLLRLQDMRKKCTGINKKILTHKNNQIWEESQQDKIKKGIQPPLLKALPADELLTDDPILNGAIRQSYLDALDANIKALQHYIAQDASDASIAEKCFWVCEGEQRFTMETFAEYRESFITAILGNLHGKRYGEVVDTAGYSAARTSTHDEVEHHEIADAAAFFLTLSIRTPLIVKDGVTFMVFNGSARSSDTLNENEAIVGEKEGERVLFASMDTLDAIRSKIPFIGGENPTLEDAFEALKEAHSQRSIALQTKERIFTEPSESAAQNLSVNSPEPTAIKKNYSDAAIITSANVAPVSDINRS